MTARVLKEVSEKDGRKKVTYSWVHGSIIPFCETHEKEWKESKIVKKKPTKSQKDLRLVYTSHLISFDKVEERFLKDSSEKSFPWKERSMAGLSLHSGFSESWAERNREGSGWRFKARGDAQWCLGKGASVQTRKASSDGLLAPRAHLTLLLTHWIQSETA